MSRYRAAAAVAVALFLAPSVIAPSTAAASPQLRSAGYTCPDGSASEDGFEDVPEDNVHEAVIDCAVAHGLLTGRTPRTYEPAAPLTRGQLASVGQRVLDALGDTGSPEHRDHFVDDDGSVHESAIDNLAALGILSGRTAATFDPDGVASRGQVAAVLVGVVEHMTAERLPAPVDHFTDDDGDVHEQAVNAAAEAGLVSGTAPGRYDPRPAVRRDQVAAVAIRSYELLSAEGYGLCPGEYPPYLRISRVEAAPAGDDLEPGAGEHVELRSEWCSNVELEGWYLRDRDGSVIVIPDGHLIRPQETFRVYTGPGPSGEGRFHDGRDREVWDDAGDSVTLHAPDDVEADAFSY